MIVTVFRSRLRPGVREEYVALVEKIAAIAKTMPGYISHKGFFADDGERVTIVEFEHEEGMARLAHRPRASGGAKAGAHQVLHRISRAGLQARPRV
jgi:antibiotic biosynthesis monooxygenase (ABM) superfamily enzyme